MAGQVLPSAGPLPERTDCGIGNGRDFNPMSKKQSTILPEMAGFMAVRLRHSHIETNITISRAESRTSSGTHVCLHYCC